MILIYAMTIQVSGYVQANGTTGTSDTSCTGDPGGSEAGGSIYLRGGSVSIGQSAVTATGGAAPSDPAGTAAANGRIQIDYATLTGQSKPPAGFGLSGVGQF